MTTAIFATLLGLALLVAGGEALVRGATRIALLARVSPTVVGLTIVAMGTSMPELVVSIRAGLAGKPDIAMGNIVGSSIFNIGAILGLAAVLAPLRVQGNTVRLEWPIMLLATLLLHLLARDRVIDRLEGGFFVVALLVFVAYTVRIARRDAAEIEHEEYAAELGPLPAKRRPQERLRAVLAVAAGVGLLAAGASSLVSGASALARFAGLSDMVIGLTVVAMGTSLPELVTSVVAAVRGHHDVAITNVIGSNIFNILGILGVTALVSPVPVAEELLLRDNWWMIALTLALFPLMRSGMRVNRAEGALLLAAFMAYMWVILAAR